MSEGRSNITTSVRLCLSLFKTILSIDAADAVDVIDVVDGVSNSLDEQKGKFTLWSANIGAHKSGTSSLEYKLRDASNIRRTVLDLLEELQRLLKDGISIIKGDVTPWDQLPPDEEDNAGIVDVDLPSTEIEQIMLDIKDIVDNLLRLSVTIHNAAPHDRFMAFSSTDTSFFEPHDVSFVRERYPTLEPWQSERLGKAISRRRQYFKYRKAHHEKLARGISLDLEDDTEHSAPSTFASSLPDHLKDSGLLNKGMDAQSESDWVSQTSFATSADKAESRPIPLLPKKAEDGPFECPFCYTIIVASTRLEWKKHVYGDLRPYICLEYECPDADQQFLRRRDWIRHMQDKHWSTYRCPVEACPETYRNSSACRQHITTNHADEGSGLDVNALVALALQEATTNVNLGCPFCQSLHNSVRSYQRHVARHMEKLCVFALPAVELDQGGLDECQSRSDISSSDKSSDSYSSPEAKLLYASTSLERVLERLERGKRVTTSILDDQDDLEGTVLDVLRRPERRGHGVPDRRDTLLSQWDKVGFEFAEAVKNYSSPSTRRPE